MTWIVGAIGASVVTAWYAIGYFRWCGSQDQKDQDWCNQSNYTSDVNSVDDGWWWW